nr:uncharacterized protein LOC127321927 [Lolium perenne]XP_051206844.1 uncharacterized protein LOC127321927 [Lolium perenne]
MQRGWSWCRRGGEVVVLVGEEDGVEERGGAGRRGRGGRPEERNKASWSRRGGNGYSGSAEMLVVEADSVQTASGSGASSYAAETETHEAHEIGCLDVDGAHGNGGGLNGEEDGLYQLSMVGAEVPIL